MQQATTAATSAPTLFARAMIGSTTRASSPACSTIAPKASADMMSQTVLSICAMPPRDCRRPPVANAPQKTPLSERLTICAPVASERRAREQHGQDDDEKNPHQRRDEPDVLIESHFREREPRNKNRIDGHNEPQPSGGGPQVEITSARSTPAKSPSGASTGVVSAVPAAPPPTRKDSGRLPAKISTTKTTFEAPMTKPSIA